MRAIFLHVLVMVFVFSTGLIYAQDNMEVKNVDNLNLLVPEDMKIRKEGNQIITEGTDTYMARKFKEMETRFEAVEEHLEKIETICGELKKELDELKEIIAKKENES